MKRFYALVCAVFVLLSVLSPGIDAQAQNPRVYVTGEVAKPGPYPHKESLTVEQALALAGGVLPEVKPRIVLVREIDGKSVVMSYPSGSDPLLPEDRLLVAAAR